MSSADFKPYAIVDVDLDRPLPLVASHDPKTGAPRGGVFCLVRRSGIPIAVAEFPLDGRDLEPSEFAARLAHLQAVPVTHRPIPSQLPPATVVIATRDRPASLAICMDSILRQDYPDFTVIVVDNAPATADTQQLIASRYAATGKVRYVRENRPGLGRAHNAGMEHVTTPVAAFTDDDVIADPRWLLALAANFAAGGNVGCATGLILPAELDTRAQYWTERHGGFGKGFARKTFDLGQNRPDNPLFPFTAGQFGSGASMAFRSDALRKTGGFDSALGAGTPARGGDDLASFYQIVAAGYQLVYEPESIVWHHHRRNEEGMERQAYNYGMGLGAYLTKIIRDEPMNGLRLLRVLPTGLRHMMGSSSPKNARLPDDYPTNFIWRERLGILAGIPGYLKSRRVAQEQDRQVAASLATTRDIQGAAG